MQNKEKFHIKFLHRGKPFVLFWQVHGDSLNEGIKYFYNYNKNWSSTNRGNLYEQFRAGKTQEW